MYLVGVEQTVVDSQLDELNEKVEHLSLQRDVTGVCVEFQ